MNAMSPRGVATGFILRRPRTARRDEGRTQGFARRLFLIGLMLLLCVPPVGAAEQTFWHLVGKSHAIVRGKLEVPVEEIREAVRSGDPRFVPVPVTVLETVKGADVPERLTLRYYSESASYGGPAPDQLVEADGREAILFLLASTRGYYFAAYSPVVLQPAADDLRQRVLSELALQDQQVREFDREIQGRIQPHDARVHALVERMVSRETDPPTAAAIYQALADLGPEAVPALIKYMDDRRPLAVPKISYAVKDPDWEGIAHYGPEVVTDLVTVILSRITGENLTQIYNGGEEVDRVNAVRLWKVYFRRQAGKM